MNKLALAATLTTLMTATAAMAGGGSYGYGRDDSGYAQGDDNDDEDGYRTPQPGSSQTDYADVLSARPIYREQRVSQPRQECHDERVVYRDRSYDRGERYHNAAGAVIGGVIGGAIGHQVSRGSGRAVATVIGAVIGSQIGQAHANERGSYGRESYGERVAYEPRCTNYADNRVERRIEAYDVTYRYNGRIYHNTLPYDPGNRLAVSVNVAPAHY